MHVILAIAGVVLREMCRRKDVYVLFILTVAVTLVMASVNLFNDDRIIRYIKEVSLLLIWVSSLVLAIGTAARQIPAEQESRTIFPLLAKPVTRAQVLLGKFAGTWAACGLALVCFYLFFGIVAASREHVWPLASYFQAVSSHWMMLGIVSALALCGSVLFSSPAANATICFLASAGLLWLGAYLNRIAEGLAQPAQTIVYALYYTLPHLEFFDLRNLIIHNWDPVAWRFWLIALAYGAVYAGIFLLLAWAAFRRKPLN